MLIRIIYHLTLYNSRGNNGRSNIRQRTNRQLSTAMSGITPTLSSTSSGVTRHSRRTEIPSIKRQLPVDKSFGNMPSRFSGTAQSTYPALPQTDRSSSMLRKGLQNPRTISQSSFSRHRLPPTEKEFGQPFLSAPVQARSTNPVLAPINGLSLRQRQQNPPAVHMSPIDRALPPNDRLFQSIRKESQNPSAAYSSPISRPTGKPFLNRLSQAEKRFGNMFRSSPMSSRTPNSTVSPTYKLSSSLRMGLENLQAAPASPDSMRTGRTFPRRLPSTIKRFGQNEMLPSSSEPARPVLPRADRPSSFNTDVHNYPFFPASPSPKQARKPFVKSLSPAKKLFPAEKRFRQNEMLPSSFKTAQSTSSALRLTDRPLMLRHESHKTHAVFAPSFAKRPDKPFLKKLPPSQNSLDVVLPSASETPPVIKRAIPPSERSSSSLSKGLQNYQEVSLPPLSEDFQTLSSSTTNGILNELKSSEGTGYYEMISGLNNDGPFSIIRSSPSDLNQQGIERYPSSARYMPKAESGPISDLSSYDIRPSSTKHEKGNNADNYQMISGQNNADPYVIIRSSSSILNQPDIDLSPYTPQGGLGPISTASSHSTGGHNIGSPHDFSAYQPLPADTHIPSPSADSSELFSTPAGSTRTSNSAAALGHNPIPSLAGNKADPRPHSKSSRKFLTKTRFSKLRI